MNNITYAEQHLVIMDGKQVGIIKAVYEEDRLIGYRYFPKGSNGGGEIFPFLRDCKNSLSS